MLCKVLHLADYEMFLCNECLHYFFLLVDDLDRNLLLLVFLDLFPTRVALSADLVNCGRGRCSEPVLLRPRVIRKFFKLDFLSCDSAHLMRDQVARNLLVKRYTSTGLCAHLT